MTLLPLWKSAFKSQIAPMIPRQDSKGGHALQKTMLCCTFMWFGALAFAQDTSINVKIFGGYSYTMRFAPAPYVGSGSENGWSVALDLDSNKWIGFRSDFVQYHTTYNQSPPHSTSYTYLFGPKVLLTRSQSPRILPYGQFLIGVATDMYFGRTSFAWALGGGADFRLSKHLYLRGEGDYLHTHFTTGDNQIQPSVKNSRPRIETGLVFRF